jgi:hypothetical protein
MSVAADAIPSPAPDWSSRTEELLCPLCGYNLRGLSQARCPECGGEFEWAKLLDPAQRVHPYLFEHHPRRNAWSFAQTVHGALWPGSFWTSLHPAQPSRVRRLLLFWLISAAILLLPLGAISALAIYHDYFKLVVRQRNSIAVFWANNPQQQASAIRTYGSVTNALDQYYPLPPSWRFFRYAMNYSKRTGALATWTLGYIAWPFITVAALMLFQITMRRARIRISHLLRCTVYSADLTPVLVATALLGIALMLRSRGMAYGVALRLPTVAVAILWLVPTWRLIVAARRYLRLPMAVPTVLLTQVIFLLLMAKAGLDWFGIDYLWELVRIWHV